MGALTDRNRAVLHAVKRVAENLPRPGVQVAFPNWGAAISLPPAMSRPAVVRVLPGLHFAYLSEASRQQLWSTPFRLSVDCDRMGFRLDGPTLTWQTALQIPSMPTLPGTIQLPVGGSPIVLMADAAPTGGYPQVGHVLAVDLPLLAQTALGGQIRFEATTLEGARAAQEKFESSMRRLAYAIDWRVTREAQ
jgi:antagonist of KipI